MHATTTEIGGPTPPVRMSRPRLVLRALAPALALVVAGAAAAAAQQAAPAFDHDRHGVLDCLDCHETPGATPPAGVAFCRSCHHTSRSGRPCSACHDDVPDRELHITVDMALPSGTVTRELPFPHSAHHEFVCRTCHSEGPSAALGKTCADCHDRHHEGGADCTRCHEKPRQWVHDPEVVHRGCAGTLCHDAFPVNDDWWRRPVCLACHRFGSGDAGGGATG